MEEQAYPASNEVKFDVTGRGRLVGNSRLTDIDKTPVSSAVSSLSSTLNQLGDEVDRIGSRTSSVRNIAPTASTELDDGRKEYGSPLFAELSRLDQQANQILRNLQNITAEIEL